MIAVSALVPLYLAFLAKHFVCDYILQTSWMVRGKEAKAGWVLPLAVHAGFHGLGTLLIVIVVAPGLWWLGPVDMAVHFLVDRTKAATTRRLGLTPADGPFWWALGTDQALHQATHFAWILLILTRS